MKPSKAFPNLERRRVFQSAYERRFRTPALDAVSLNTPQDPTTGPRPRFQTINCLNEREESFRRHLEEAAPDCKTFGAAGFFNIVMDYRGAADAHDISFCPIVLTPAHWVEEQVSDHRRDDHERRKKVRKALGTSGHFPERSSRSFALGAFLSAGFGVPASLPLVLRVPYPRLAGRLHDRFGEAVDLPPHTELCLERTGDTPGATREARGFTVAETATAAERLLRDIGLIADFADFFLSQASIVLVGLEIHSENTTIGSTALWLSVIVSLGGLGLILRSLEARFGRLTFECYRGLYATTPTLAIGFVLFGLGSVGFPETMGFIASEALLDGVIESNVVIGLVMVRVAALNGIAVMRVYFLLFTAADRRSSLDLAAATRERVAILILSAISFGCGLVPEAFISKQRLGDLSTRHNDTEHRTAAEHK